MLSSRKQFELLAQKTGGLYEPTEHEIARMKQIFLMIYKDIFKVCRENGLTLLLGGGSALGAIRHKGFIPWDDDIDLMMPRADYETFKKIFAGTLSDKYVLQVPNADGCEISNLYMKVILRGTERKELQKLNAPGLHGLWVDIFPIEGLPTDKKKVKRHYYIAKSMVTMRKLAYFQGISGTMSIQKFIRIVSRPFAKLMGYRFWNKCLLKIAKKYKYEECEYVGVVTSCFHTMEEYIRREGYGTPVKVEFEGKLYNAPADTHTYLSNLYGDYMQLPPVEKRVAHHFSVYESKEA